MPKIKKKEPSWDEIGKAIGQKIENSKWKDNMMKKQWTWHEHKHYGSGIYFLGFIGALIYYLQGSQGFWPIVIAILKALVWPAFLVYHLLGL